MKYQETLIKAMKMLGEDERTLFIGQSVKYTGTGLFWTLREVLDEKRIELPIMEDVQLGMCIGLSLEGYIPICLYPRMDFMTLCMNQLALHLDKLEELSSGQFKPKVIIRTAIGSTRPLFPGVQHNNDWTEAFKLMCPNINIIKLINKEDIIPAYKKAMEDNKSWIIVEMPDLYET